MWPERLPFSAVAGAILIAALPAALALALTGGATGSRTAGMRVRAIDGPTIAADVSRLRGLEFSDVPTVEAIGSRQKRRLARRLARKGRHGASPSSAARRIERASRAGLEWARLVGFVGPGFKIGSAGKALGASVVGEFQPSSHKILVQTSRFDPPHYEDVIAAHELDHALDAEHFPAVFHSHETPGNSERTAAVQALVEGTATVITDRFAHEHGYAVVGPGRRLFSIDNLGFGVPAGLAAEFRFPYTAGADFVRYLLHRGGWQLVNQAFRHPPTSTAEVLDPRRWVRRDTYRHLRVPTSLGSPWRLVGRTDSGALDARVLLSLGLSLTAATEATQGWDGGAIATWRRPAPAQCRAPCRQATASVAAYRWQSPVRAGSFVGALPAYLETRLLARPVGNLAWRLHGGFAAIDQRNRGTAIALAPTKALAHRLAAAGVRGANH